MTAAAASALLLAGCGGGGGKKQQPAGTVVAGAGFTYVAPSKWTATVTARGAIAKQDEITLVSVTVLPLTREYRASLFAKVARGLDVVADQLATRLHGAVTARQTVIVAGRRVRRYELAHGGLVDRVTFVLADKREFQLTCRWRTQDGEPGACAQLESTFRLK
jgi:hypothetical protein